MVGGKSAGHDNIKHCQVQGLGKWCGKRRMWAVLMITNCKHFHAQFHSCHFAVVYQVGQLCSTISATLCVPYINTYMYTYKYVCIHTYIAHTYTYIQPYIQPYIL